MNSEIGTVKSFFQSIQVHLSDVWLESCINWCKSEILTANYTLKELQSKVYEQWLLLDLRDVEIACLPPNLSSQKHFVLNGNFCLQMMHVIDISKPKLWQLQRIRNSHVLTRGTQQDSDVVGTGKRMLQLTLTDGVQEVEAMEFKPISCLSINLKPGIKIRIMGPVVVRRGRLMLEQQNVKILGGEVEDLLVSQAAENVLARALKLPENPNPGIIEERMLVVENKDENEGYKRITEIKKSQPQQSIPKTNINAAPLTRLDQEEMESEEIKELLLEAARNPPGSNESKTPDLFEDDDFNPDDFDCLDQFAATSTQAVGINNRNQRNPSFGDDDVFNEIDIDAHLDEIDKKSKENQPQAIIPKVNTMTIAKLLEKKDNITRGVFKIKAKFKCVVEKLTVDEEEYKLVIKIEDGTSELTVKVHSNLISEFAGYRPEDIQKLKSGVLDKNKDATEKIMNAIQKVKDKLVALDDILVIEIMKNEMPVIIKVQ